VTTSCVFAPLVTRPLFAFVNSRSPIFPCAFLYRRSALFCLLIVEMVAHVAWVFFFLRTTPPPPPPPRVGERRFAGIRFPFYSPPWRRVNVIVIELFVSALLSWRGYVFVDGTVLSVPARGFYFGSIGCSNFYFSILLFLGGRVPPFLSVGARWNSPFSPRPLRLQLAMCLVALGSFFCPRKSPLPIFPSEFFPRGSQSKG